MLPTSLPIVLTGAPAAGDYTNSGFDRGHLCPSDNRDGSATADRPEDNAATFYMSNIVPEAPTHNRQAWKNLKDYCRSLLTQGQELYIIAGTYGRGGEGDLGMATTIGGGKVTVPAVLWKVAVILPVGSNAISRIDTQTRVIAVWMPNTNTVGEDKWSTHRTSIDEIERQTGFDLLNKVPVQVQQIIESRVDAVVL